MWPAGTVLHNPVTHEWARVVVPDDGTNETIVAEIVLMPTAHPAGPHYHPHMSERFEVVSGQLNVIRDGQLTVLGPGETGQVDAGVAHDFWNASSEPVHGFASMTPPRTFADMVGAIWGLAALGRTNDYGMPGPLDGVLVMRAFADDVVFLKPPRFVQTVAAKVLGPIVAATGRTVTAPEVVDGAVVDADRWPAEFTSSTSTP